MNNEKNFVRNKEKSAEILSDIHSYIWQGTLDNLPTDEEKTRGSRNVALQKDTENATDEIATQNYVWTTLSDNSSSQK